MIEKTSKSANVSLKREIQHHHGGRLCLKAARLVINSPRIKSDPSQSSGQTATPSEDLHDEGPAAVLDVKSFVLESPWG